VDDPFAVLREHDERVRREGERTQAQRKAEALEQQQYDDAWSGVLQACQAGHAGPDTPDLSSFRKLAAVLKSRGWDVWLPDMANNAKAAIDDILVYRPGVYFIVQLLILAGKPRATDAKLARAYRSFQPQSAPVFWRLSAAEGVRDFLRTRADQARKAKDAETEERRSAEAAERRERLAAVARRRTAIEKQLFAVHWADCGLRPAAIRNKWNALHRSERLEDGRPGRHDIGIAIARGRKFLADNQTSIAEMASILGLSFGP
jgi:hypothetical protein